MALHTGSEISDTYKGILNISNDNTGLTAVLKTVQTSDGANSILQLSTTNTRIGSMNFTGTTISSVAGTDLNITPLAGQQIVLDGTIIIDAGVVTGATSITSTAFIGTLSTAAQPNVTSLGILTTLTVDDITINANAISSGGASSLTITPTTGQKLILDGHWGFDGVAFTAETNNNTTFTAYAGKNITIESTTFDNNVVTATTFSGALSGNASTATALATARTIGGTSFDGTANIVPSTITIADESADTTCFVGYFTAATGSLQPKTGTNLAFNSSSGALTATSFVGALTGNASTSTLASTVTVDATTADTTCFPAIFESASGSLEPQTDAGLTYNANTNALTTTTFVGALTGQADTVGTITGLAPDTATTQAAQTNITSLGTLTSLGVGAITSTGKLDITLTTEQMRLNYDATNYAHFTVADDGGLTITTVDADATSADIVLAPDGVITLSANTTVNSNYVLEGYPTGRNVFRSIFLSFAPGATPGTNINIVDNSSAVGHGFNAPSTTDATNLAKSGTSGSFSLDANGKYITLDLTETVVHVKGYMTGTVKWNSASTTEFYSFDCSVSSGNILISMIKRAATSPVDLTTILDASDAINVQIDFITST